MLTQLRGQLAELLATRSGHQATIDSIIAACETEARDLNESETSSFNEARAAIAAVDADIASVEARIADLEAIETSRAAAEAAAARLGSTAPAVVTNEPRTYTAESAREGRSFMADLANTLTGDADAIGRIQRHRRETEAEMRDVGTGAFAGLVVPQYLTDLVAPKRRAGRPTLDICNQHPLPASGLTVNISRITTGTGAAAQASENSAVTETNMDDTLLTVNVRTYAGMQDVSRQALDRGTGVEQIVLADLIREHDTKLDSGIINSDGTSGTHLGILSTSSIVSVTYTDLSPTVAEAYPKLFDLIQQIQSGVFMGVSHLIMHPRRWWWFLNAVGTSFPFIQQNGNDRSGVGNGTSTYENGAAGVIAGVPVILDANIATNTGAGTNEDTILGVTADELHFWSDPVMQIRAEQTLADQLSVRFVVFSYSAFTAGRYPGAHGTITGTGLVTPTYTGA